MFMDILSFNYQELSTLSVSQTKYMLEEWSAFLFQIGQALNDCTGLCFGKRELVYMLIHYIMHYFPSSVCHGLSAAFEPKRLAYESRCLILGAKTPSQEV